MGPLRWCLLLLLLLTASTDDVKILDALVGGRIQMVPVFSGVVAGFEWKKGTQKIIEVDFPLGTQGKPEPYVLKDRSDLNLTTGVLTISSLQLTDSGIYTADVLISQQYQKTTFRLVIFPALNKPTVSCNDTTQGFHVWCHHDPDPLTYEWYSDGQPIASILHNYNFIDRNRSLTVGLADLKFLKSLECIVRNPVTENRTSVPETCYAKEYSTRSRAGLIALAAILFLVMLLTFCGIFGPKDSRLHRLCNWLCKWKQGYNVAATDNAKGDQNSGGGPLTNVNEDRSANVHDLSPLETKHADAVPNIPSARPEPDRTEGESAREPQDQHVEVHDPFAAVQTTPESEPV